MNDRASIRIIDVDGDKNYSLDSLAESMGVSKLVIGTAEDAHIRVENSKVSAHHGYFFKQNGMWAYQDTDSRTGSSVKGSRITSTWLANGMQLILDSRRNLDSLIIDVKVEILSGRNLLPGETPPEGWGNPAPSGPTYGGAFSGAYNGSANDAYYNPTGGAAGAASPGFGFAGADRYGSANEKKFADSLNIFGLLAGILWGILAVVNIIAAFKTFNNMEGVTAYLSGFYTLLLWVIVLGVVGSAVGDGMLSVGLFTYNKDIMTKGAIVMAAGNVAMVLALMIMLTEMLGGAFVYIFSNFEILLMIIAIILMPAAMVSQAKNFKSNNDYSKIYHRYYRPIIYYGLAFVMVIIATLSLSNRFGMNINFLEMMPSSNVWVTIASVGAIVLSAIYLHVDEEPGLAARFATKK